MGRTTDASEVFFLLGDLKMFFLRSMLRQNVFFDQKKKV